MIWVKKLPLFLIILKVLFLYNFFFSRLSVHYNIKHKHIYLIPKDKFQLKTNCKNLLDS